MFERVPTEIPGCFGIRTIVRSDARGHFVKSYVESWFQQQGLQTRFKETFFSLSKRDVVRGMHFQTPPHDQDKLVCCVSGKILDAVVDLRVGSPAYGRHVTFELEGDGPLMVYVPRGLAHGFRALSEEAIVHYSVSSEYAPASDTGIHWRSAGIAWNVASPIVSARDEAFEPLANFRSPFTWRGEG